MLMDMLILFIILSIIFFILSVYLMEENPKLSIPFIMLGMIFTILVAYGLWNVEVLYVGYDAATGIANTSLYSTASYGNPYSYVFVLVFFIYLILFFNAGFNMWKQALETQSEIDYKNKPRRWR